MGDLYLVAGFRLKPMTDAEMEAIITSGLNRAVAQDLEACARIANVEASFVRGASELAMGKGAGLLGHGDEDPGFQPAATELESSVNPQTGKSALLAGGGAWRKSER